MHITKYKYAGIGAVAGMLLWLVLRYLGVWLQSVLPQLDAVTDRHSFLLAAALALVFAVVFPLGEHSWKLFKRHVANRSLVGMLFHADPEVNIVIPHMAQTDFERVDTHQRVPLPENCPFLPATHGIAIGKLTEHVSFLFSSGKRVAISYDQAPPADLAEHNFIVMGGPFVNRMGRGILAHYANSCLKDFSITTDAAGSVTANYGKSGDRFTAVINQERLLTEDYGFVIIVPSHLNRQKRACFMFGLWPQGTMAAVDALVTEHHPPHLAKRLRKLVRQRKSLLAVVKVVATGLVDGRCNFENVFELS